MPVVIDTNQASRLPRGKKREWVLSLSPYVMAEILLRRNPTPTLTILRAFAFYLGLELLDVMIQLSRLSPEEISVFEPFTRPGQKYGQNYDVMVSAMNHVRPTHIKWAKYIKQSHQRYMSTLRGNALRFRRRLREHGLANVKCSSFEEALAAFATSPDSFLATVIVGSITYGGRRTTQTRPDDLFEAVMENQYLGRFFRAKLAYMLSISRVWKDQTLNKDPSTKYDDMTDITLLLYAEDGDLILSNDNYLSRLVAVIEPKGTVKVCKVGNAVQ